MSLINNIELVNQQSTSSSSVTWRNWVNLFAKGLEYDYFVEINAKGWDDFLLKKPIRVAKNLDVGILYDSEKKQPKDRIKFKTFQNQSSDEEIKADVVLHWDEEKSSLSAECTKTCSAPVYYCSHLNDGDKKLIEIGEKVDIYRFEDLHQKLAKKRDEIKFDPRGTMIRFAKFKDVAVCVVLRSRTAACLYQTFA